MRTMSTAENFTHGGFRKSPLRKREKNSGDWNGRGGKGEDNKNGKGQKKKTTRN